MNIKASGALLLGLALLLAWALWAEPEFDRVDAHALACPVSSEQSLDRLVAYLCPPSYSERDKARSLFRWIADRIAYDAEGLRQNKMGDQSPQGVLKDRKAVCAGYSRLYEALGKKAGLQVESLTGDSKFNDQLPIKLPPGVSGHAWNAVWIRGRWMLCDPTWAAGKVDDKFQFQKGFDDFWFCTPPDQFVYTHWPKESHWQLLSQAWTRQRFDEVPLLRGEFFRLGLRASIDTVQPLRVTGEKVLRWQAPADVVGISDLRSSTGEILKNWTFSQSPRGFLETRVRCPAAGNFTLRVYARQRQKAWQGNLSDPAKFPGIALVKVEATRASSTPFPKTFGSFQRAGAELLEPLDGVLKSGRDRRFRLRVPEAEKVVVFAGDNQVAELDAKSSVFQGILTVPVQSPPLQVCAKYPQESRYWGLVEYQVR